MDPRPILDPSGLLHQGSDPLDFTDHWGSLTMDSGLQQNFNGLDDGSNGGRVVGQDMQLGDTSLTTGPLAIGKPHFQHVQLTQFFTFFLFSLFFAMSVKVSA